MVLVLPTLNINLKYSIPDVPYGIFDVKEPFCVYQHVEKSGIEKCVCVFKIIARFDNVYRIYIQQIHIVHVKVYNLQDYNLIQHVLGKPNLRQTL